MVSANQKIYFFLPVCLYFLQNRIKLFLVPETRCSQLQIHKLVLVSALTILLNSSIASLKYDFHLYPEEIILLHLLQVPLPDCTFFIICSFTGSLTSTVHQLIFSSAMSSNFFVLLTRI